MKAPDAGADNAHGRTTPTAWSGLSPGEVGGFAGHRTLTVEVADDDTRAPRPRRAGRDAEGGRGLQLVNELAHRWGSRTTRHGKIVWAELDLPV